MYVQVARFPSLFATEIHFSPWDTYLGCKQKSYLLIAVLKPDNRKLVFWYPLENSRTVLPAPESGSPLVLWWAIPFSRLTESRRAAGPVADGRCGGRSLCYWWEGRGGCGGEQPSTCTEQVVHFFQTLTSYLWSLRSMNCHTQPLPRWPKCRREAEQNIFKLCMFNVILKLGQDSPPRGR